MRLSQLLLNLFKWLFVLSLFGIAYGLYKKDVFPNPSFYDARVQQEPSQRRLTKAPFTTRAGEQRYEISPLFDYELTGMVVSHHHSDQWDDIYHRGHWADFLNIKDLCVIWGKNVASGIYRNMHFENSTWTCWAYWPDQATANRFQMAQLSNNHLLSDNPALTRRILEAEPGDMIRMKGWLAGYKNLGNNYSRGTSTTRTDTGNGACETVFVRDFTILNKANKGVRRLYNLSKWMALISLIGVVVMASIAPVTFRR
ncbi:MAG: hypothetical protein KJ558_06095 [Gammaproteobacteria bacterium]|nr:hypothetical protein [Gammaproteobacteria bacterium]MBU1654389.1 hypothetical protein [Gammaproteobacteria bacterium]MBU1960230.1 hypothetical protein [Gammaproteobacteria bacterium]